KAGALDTFSPNRAALFATLSKAMQSAAELQQDRKRGQRSIFDMFDGTANGAADALPALVHVPAWSHSEQLKHEKEALDFYFSSHPLAQFEAELRRYATHSVEQLDQLEPGQEVLLGGMMSQVRYMNVKKSRNGNTRYVRCNFEDFTGQAECVMWPDDFLKFKDAFGEDRVCFVRGTVERNREKPGLILTRVMDMDAARRELTRGLIITLATGEQQPGVLDEVAKVLRKTPGPCPVYLQVCDPVGKRATLRAGESFRINPGQLRVAELEMLLGPGRVTYSGR